MGYMPEESKKKLLGWHMPENLRWLAEQGDRPGYMPCGMLTGEFLKLCASRWEGEIEKRRELEQQLAYEQSLRSGAAIATGQLIKAPA